MAGRSLVGCAGEKEKATRSMPKAAPCQQSYFRIQWRATQKNPRPTAGSSSDLDRLRAADFSGKMQMTRCSSAALIQFGCDSFDGRWFSGSVLNGFALRRLLLLVLGHWILV